MVAGGRAGQRGNDHRKTAVAEPGTPAGCQTRGSNELHSGPLAEAQKPVWTPAGVLPLPTSPRAVAQSQRDCFLQPRVARHELPWV